MEIINTDNFFETLSNRLTDENEIRRIHEEIQTHRNLVMVSSEAVEEEPSEITTWIGALRLLHGIPFHYLVPDPEMLPQESIRFFYLDPTWVHYLIDGAYSIGRKSKMELSHDQALAETVIRASYAVAGSLRKQLFGLPAENSPDRASFITGFLIRSQAVADWPGMEVKAWDKNGTLLEALRIEQLAKTVLLAFFDGDLFKLRLDKPSETLHFGVRDGQKTLRKKDGNPWEEKPPVKVKINDQRVIDVSQLAEAIFNEIKDEFDIKELSSAEFALQMVDPIEQVIFEKQEDHKE